MKYLFIYRHLLQFHNSQGYHSVQYNGKGTRLLSDEAHNKCIIIDLPSTTEQSTANEMGKIQLTNPYKTGYFITNLMDWRKPCCFAGQDDELVAAVMVNGAVCVWSVPDGRGSRVIDQPLFVTGSNRKINATIRYSRQNCLLATCGFGNDVIKFWSPFKLPGNSSSNLELAEGDSSSSDCYFSSDSGDFSYDEDAESSSSDRVQKLHSMMIS